MPSLLFCQSNFSFLTGASHPEELISTAAELGYNTIAITDECSLAGVVKAYAQTKTDAIQLLIGSLFKLANGMHIIAYAPTRQAYAELSGLITLARRRSEKGEYHLEFNDLQFRLKTCLLVWLPQRDDYSREINLDNFWLGKKLQRQFKERLWIGVNHNYAAGEAFFFNELQQLSLECNIPLLACDHVLMHSPEQKKLHDVLSAIRLNTSVQRLGNCGQANSESHIKNLHEFYGRYSVELINEADYFCEQFSFSLEELKYEYPKELVPKGITPIDYLRQLVNDGISIRWPKGIPAKIAAKLDYELTLIEELRYEYYFLTVNDIVTFARSRDILCQGRGSAANSIVCYCLQITEVSPELIDVLFERFISRERDEPPDIDVDFEHQRREEVIQYIYDKYGRERAALTATVITYRARSAVRDVGKALGFDESLLDHLSKNIAWWDRTEDLKIRFAEYGVDADNFLLQHFCRLVHSIIGFPRHLSQHVGGFVISEGKISEMVPIENASMAGRTVIQWDKTDIETLGLLKVDVLALGMLTALHQCLKLVNKYQPTIQTLQDIPQEDPHTYAMLSRADSVGVFQVESRAQMAMLPRLKPKTFYDLVIEIAIVRPGPIQGDMVHPYLRRRDGIEPISYPSDAIKSVLQRTLGVPIFQEQAIKIAMVAAGFSGGEADQLRRAMAAWGRNGNLLTFKDKLINGMLARGYELNFAERMFEQLKGFGGYGFPESHSASFANLCYFSSWFKCHHPAAFYIALLNSQPMGFYSPSQLVQDATRHNVKVLPVDILKSHWLTTLEQNPNNNHLGVIRLGFSRVKGFNEESAKRVIEARKNNTELTQIIHAAKLEKSEINLLASADALQTIAGNRYQAHWLSSGVETYRPLINAQKSEQQKELPEVFNNINQPDEYENIQQDYQTTGLSLRRHPMAILRNQFPFNRCKTSADLNSIHHGGFIRIAGLVTGRQKPGSAKGVLFLTLEDEFGNTNVVVWKRVQEQYRTILLTSKLLQINGVVETDNNVVHVIAGKLTDLSEYLMEFNVKSRDFH
ncbi:error-prone DNA polymerase [Sessilibacter sp. MAH4]